jgi:hypothetical protein
MIALLPNAYKRRSQLLGNLLVVLREIEERRIRQTFRRGKMEELRQFEATAPQSYGMNGDRSTTKELIAEIQRFLGMLETYMKEAKHAGGANHAAAKRASLDVTRKLAEWRREKPYVKTEEGFTFK